MPKYPTFRGREVILAYKALEKFRLFMENNITLPFQYDMAIALLKYLSHIVKYFV